MNVHHTLICFFFLSLQDGNTEDTKPQNIFYGVIGGNFTAEFNFQDNKLKIFCKEKCEGENILINTTDVRDQRGRYSIEYKSEGGVPALSLSISDLTMSDAGQYRCGLGESLSSASYTQFEIIVAEALLDGNHDPSQQKHFYKETGSSLTVGCSFNASGKIKSFCRGACGGDQVLVQTDGDGAQSDRYRIGQNGFSGGVIVYVTITQLTHSDSGQYRCSLNRTSAEGSFRDFGITVTEAVNPSASTPSLTFTATTKNVGQNQPPAAAAGISLYVGLTVAVIIILLSVVTLIICKKRACKVKGPHAETEYAVVTEGSPVYEDIREEDVQNGSSPLEINSLYSYAKYNKETGAETSDDYSLATAGTSQEKTEDDSSKPTSSELNTSRMNDDSPNTEEGDRCVAQADESSDAGQSRDDPMYSTIT